MEGGSGRLFFRLILGKGLDHKQCTRFYRLIEFCLESLHIPYSQYLELPPWEKRMYRIYLDIRDQKQELRDIEHKDMMDQLRNKDKIK